MTRSRILRSLLLTCCVAVLWPTPSSVVFGFGLESNTGGGVATGLKTATTTVDVSAATAPTVGQVLTASNSTTAAWVTPTAGAATNITPGTTTIIGATAPCLIRNSATTVMDCLAIASGNSTALGVTTGSAGAPVLFNGAGGTPSSLTGTNISGTAASLTAGTATVANGLNSATTTVVVSAATAPTNGQVLTASSGTVAAWATPTGGATGVGVDGGTAAVALTASCVLGTGGSCSSHLIRQVKIGAISGATTFTLDAIANVSSDSCVRFEDAASNVSGANTVTITANASDAIGGGGTGGSVGPFVTPRMALTFCVTATHNWTMQDGVLLAATSAPTHQFFNALSAIGVITSAQPAISDVSGFGTGVATSLGNTLNSATGLVGSLTPTLNNCPVGNGSAWTSAPCPSGSTGVGVDGGTAFATVTGTGIIGNAVEQVNIGTGWATGTLTLPALSAINSPTTGCIRFHDGGNFVDGSHTLTIAANAADKINGGATGGTIGPITTTGSGLMLCSSKSGSGSNWNVLTSTTIASSTASAHQFATAVGINGLTYTQPAFSDISGAAVAAQIPATPLTTGTSITVSGVRSYIVCTSTCTVTLPVPAAGAEYCVMNDDNVNTVITLAALGSSARYENTARTAYGTAGTGTFVSGGAVGDKVCIVGRDSTHYLTPTSTGTWVAS